MTPMSKGIVLILQFEAVPSPAASSFMLSLPFVRGGIQRYNFTNQLLAIINLIPYRIALTLYHDRREGWLRNQHQIICRMLLSLSRQQTFE